MTAHPVGGGVEGAASCRRTEGSAARTGAASVWSSFQRKRFGRALDCVRVGAIGLEQLVGRRRRCLAAGTGSVV